MIKDLAKLATRLDRLGLTKEADVLDAALQKVAQQVATTGVEGATYSGGRQITPGFAGGPTVKFYKARPKSISEFNAFLGALISNAAADPRQTSFSPAVIRNLPSKADTTWGSKTGAAFKEYAAAAGSPEAGFNWESFANKSGKYEPTMNGIFRFWEDTIAKVDSDVALTQSLEESGRVKETKREVAPTGPAKIDWGPGPSPRYNPENPLEGLNTSSSPGGSQFTEKELRDLDIYTEEEIQDILAKRKSSESPSAAGAKGILGNPRDFFLSITWQNTDPHNALGYWNVSESDKQKILSAYMGAGSPQDQKSWARSYIINNKIPGGWIGRGPGGKEVQSRMAPISGDPSLPPEIDPRDLYSMGGGLNSFKDEMERFPKSPVTFMGWSRSQLDAYLARHDFKLQNGKLIDLRTARK